MKPKPPVALPLPWLKPFRYWTRQEITYYEPTDTRTERIVHWRMLCEGWPENRPDVMVWAWRFVSHEFHRASRFGYRDTRFWLEAVFDRVYDDFIARFGSLSRCIDREAPYNGLCMRIRLSLWDAKQWYLKHRMRVRGWEAIKINHATMSDPERACMFADDLAAFRRQFENEALKLRRPCDRAPALRSIDRFFRREVDDQSLNDKERRTLDGLPAYAVVALRGFAQTRLRRMVAEAPKYATTDERTMALAFTADDEVL